jgi:hypothetical protein
VKYAAAIAVLTLIAVVRVGSTGRVFSATHDEPAHLSSAYEWWTGSYTIDLGHPPLARILCGFPLWLASDRQPQHEGDFFERTNALLYQGRYEKNLARARRGNLVLLIAAILGVAAWTRRGFGDSVAIVAVALFTSLPPILGHAGVATTDLAVAAALPWALLALQRYYERPTLPRGALLGIAIGFGLLAKFSFIVYFPPAAIVVTLMHRPRATIRSALAMIATAFLIVWAGYRFEFRSASAIFGEDNATRLFASAGLPARLANIPLPAVSYLTGVAIVRSHDSGQNVSYLLGNIGSSWWFYFPVILFYKTPLPFLILFAWGLRSRAVLMFTLIALAILGVAMTSHINIGVRHVLPFYVPATAVAAYAAVETWKRSRDAFARTALAALAAWLVIGVAVEHPDYLAWFNEAARPEPSAIAIDSNLDWGQEGLRLARAVREIGIDDLKLWYAMNIRAEAHGIYASQLGFGPQHGWIAVSEAPLRFLGEPEKLGWLAKYRPVRRIGKSLRLYYIP